jgi:glutaredoxin
MIFSATYCSYCNVAKRTFESLGTTFGSVELNKVEDGPELARDLKEVVGNGYVNVIEILSVNVIEILSVNVIEILSVFVIEILRAIVIEILSVIVIEILNVIVTEILSINGIEI